MNIVTKEDVNCPECGEFTGLEWFPTHGNNIFELSCTYCHISLCQATAQQFADFVNGNDGIDRPLRIV